jgi:glycosyltransferase involved in cell wall biosynthesis
MSQPISIVTELYEPSVGGQESRFARFAEALAGHGRDVTVYTTDPTGGALPREASINRVTVLRYVELSDYVRNGSRGWAPLVAYWRSTRRLLHELIPRTGSVWVNEMPVVHLLGTRGASNLVVDWCEYPTYWMVNALARRVMKQVQRGTAVSEAVAEHIRKVRRDADVEVVRTPVALPSGPVPERDDRTVSYVGRLVGHKNIASLAEAIKLYNSNGGPHARLVIAGDGPDRQALERRFGGNGTIEFLGLVDEAVKRKLLQSSWLVAVPGSREGLPNVAAEATVYGTPLLASGSFRNSCGDYIRTNHLGVVARGSSPADFLAALKTVDDASWSQWSARATELGSLFDPVENLRRLEAALDRGAK